MKTKQNAREGENILVRFGLRRRRLLLKIHWCGRGVKEASDFFVTHGTVFNRFASPSPLIKLVELSAFKAGATSFCYNFF